MADRAGEAPDTWLLQEQSKKAGLRQSRCFVVPLPLRRICLRLIQWRWFDIIILFVIILNCFAMAFDSPLEPSSGTVKADILFRLELGFNTIFTLEMTVKILALGWNRYLKDSWNMLDVVVVTSAWAPYLFPSMGNYSAIRAVRVLRALRTVNRVPELRKIILTLLGAIPQVR